MFLKLVLLFTCIPLIELSILMKLGAAYGVGLTLFIIIGTGILGAYLAKLEGYRVLFRIQQETKTGRMPAAELVDAVLIFVAGVLLLTPGLLTDILGFCILFPGTRIVFKRWIVKKIKEKMGPGFQPQNMHYPIE
ncbi:MAG: FxsA family protein [Candidatus Omnitrophica bacterium]|nr:FxsA family protein [Candidatus Omnitrophota bacterium]